MSNPGDADTTPIESVAQLAAFIAQGCKPQESFRIGTEHEKFGFRHADLAPPAYDNGGIRAVIEGLAKSGGEPITDNGQPIGPEARRRLGLAGAGRSVRAVGRTRWPTCTKPKRNSPRISMRFARSRRTARPRLRAARLPPSGDARRAMPMDAEGPLRHHAALHAAGRQPRARHDDAHLYGAGQSGLSRPKTTCAASCASACCCSRWRPRLFANSPFTEGRPNGYQSYRAHIWTDTDNQRSGIPRLMLDDDFGFARYASWLIDEVPMYFVYRNGRYIDVAGRSFRAFMDGKVPELDGETATIGDFADHMTTVFTDVRLKRFLEMRGADAGSPAMMLAQSAFWVGLLYDDAALEAALALLRGVDFAAVAALRAAVPREGIAASLDAPWPVRTLRALAAEAIAIARAGLVARARRDSAGRDESRFLDPLASYC